MAKKRQKNYQISEWQPHHSHDYDALMRSKKWSYEQRLNWLEWAIRVEFSEKF